MTPGDNPLVSNELSRIANALRSTCEMSRILSQDAGLRSIEKQDTSPVTIADLAVQIAVRRVLDDHIGTFHLVAEESGEQLRADQSGQLTRQLQTALRPLGLNMTRPEMIAALDSGDHTPSGPGRYWVLDPIDGTKGFLRGDQYAIALAEVVDGQVRQGILCCPAFPGFGRDGVIALAEKTKGAFLQTAEGTRTLQVNERREFAECVMCESVESGHSAHDWSSRLAAEVGLIKPPYRLDSQAKYFALAAGLGDIYLRLPTNPTYVEKAWDHAAGKLLVEEAGAVVTDVDGKPLDFSTGRMLTGNRGVVVAPKALQQRLLDALAAT